MGLATLLESVDLFFFLSELKNLYFFVLVILCLNVGKDGETSKTVVSIEFSPLSTVELTTNWYQLHNGDYKGILDCILGAITCSYSMLL